MTDRVALITGAARGIGAGIARRLAENGAAVGVLDLSEESAAETVRALQATGGSAVALEADVADAVSVDAAVERLVDRFGRLDILINNAGVTRDNLLFKMTSDDWDSVMQVHLRGAFNVTKSAQRFMVPAKYGRIVNMSSTSALGNRGQANYAAAKAGLQGFTKTVAIELGPFGITVNAIAPGYIDTEMTRATAERLGVPLEQRLAEVAAATPVRRVGQPADIAEAALYFVSEEASYVTGQVLYVDGGRGLL
ncbi:MAG: 3-oxoacyl-ACP reductase FabG [Actinobacteria bacterium]|nr:3-oxoacyl-ACP reductase FabG [Actinomycetota bacterium]